MKYFIVGLGNPGEEYKNTRHNTGRIVASVAAKKFDATEWKTEKTMKALTAKGSHGKHSLIFLLPEGFMNNSGKSVAGFVKSKKDAERTVVIYDDLDLPAGSFKLSFNRGSGGHRGLDSVIRALKTREFVRIRIGISPVTPGGKIKKPQGEKKVQDFILGNFSDKETETLKKTAKRAVESIETLVAEGREKAMSVSN